MKLLLDENLPKKLKYGFPGHEVYTVSDMGWNGVKNGQLLQLMIEHSFEALLTFDKNLQYQQNFRKYTIAVFILSAVNNTYAEIIKLIGKVQNYLSVVPMATGPIIVGNSVT